MTSRPFGSVNFWASSVGMALARPAPACAFCGAGLQAATTNRPVTSKNARDARSNRLMVMMCLLPSDAPQHAGSPLGLYNRRMARYTLVYGVRLIPEGAVKGLEDAKLTLTDGSTAGLTLHTIDGTIPQLRRALD